MARRVGVPGAGPDARAGSADEGRDAGRRDVDQVEAVRDWLRQRGVDPGESAPFVGTRGVAGSGPAAGSSSSAGPAHPGEDDPWTSDDPQHGLGGGSRHGSDREQAGRGRSAGGRGVRRRRGGRHDGEGGQDGSGTPGAASPDDPRSADPDADPEELARRIVVNQLAVQARTRTELERALARRDVPEEAAASVLDRMGEIGLIDDATFARDWVASRQQRRHLSRTALRRELQTKGVDRDLIDDALAEVAPDDERGAALDLARRRASAMGGVSRDVAYRRLGGVLARRGFSGSVVAQVLDEVLSERVD